MRALPGTRGVTAASAVLLLAAAGALSYTLKYTSQNKIVKWQTGFAQMYTDPYNLNPGTNEGTGFRQAIGSWNSVQGSAFRFGVSDSAHAPYGLLPVNDGFNDVQYINLSLGSGVLAASYTLASFSYDDATGFNRDTDMDFTTTEVYDFETVALHEQGHILGLAHTSDTSAVMYAYYTGVLRTLQTDDRNGVKALYPVSSGGGGPGPPPTPNGLPLLYGTVIGISASDLDVKSGDQLDFSCTLSNATPGGLFFQALFTEPTAAAPFSEVLLSPGASVPVVTTLTISEVPGTYPMTATFVGLDKVNAYRAVGQGPSPVVVSRDPIPVALGDRLAASLGPSGVDRTSTFLLKGTKIYLELRGDMDNGMVPSLSVRDPDGNPVNWTGKPVRARKAGFHTLQVANSTLNRGNYNLFTQTSGPAKFAPSSGVLAAGTPAEVGIGLFARSGGVLSVAGSKKLDLRITGLVSPSGGEVGVVPGASVDLPDVGEDGIWTVRVESGAGGAGKFKVSFKGAWTPGKIVSR